MTAIPNESPQQRLGRLVEQYQTDLLRMCYIQLHDTALADDAVQETFLKYMTKSPAFNDSEHEKAWLLRVASNECKDMLRMRRHSSLLSLDDIRELGAESEDDAQVLALLCSLDEKYRAVIQLHYVEGYKINELAEILGITQAAVKKRLQRGREALRSMMEKEAE